MLGCGGSCRSTSLLSHSLASGNFSIATVGTGITGHLRTRLLVGRALCGFKDISIVIGGTNITFRNLVARASRISFSHVVSVGLGNAFGYYGTTTRIVVGRGSNGVVGISSV